MSSFLVLACWLAVPYGMAAAAYFHERGQKAPSDAQNRPSERRTASR